MAAPESSLLTGIPAPVMEEFCRNMDCLSDSDWMHFASHVIRDQTELRRIKSMEKTGTSITRELMWCWGQKSATVKELLVLLEKLQLLRAQDVILNGCQRSYPESPKIRASSDDRRDDKALESPPITNLKPKENGPTPPPKSPDRTPLFLPDPPSPPASLLESLRPSCDSDVVPPQLVGVDGVIPPPPAAPELSHQNVDAKSSECTPLQETCPMLPGGCVLWTQEEVRSATNDLSEENIICSGDFANVYRGQRGRSDYAIKKLKEHAQYSKQSCIEMFFHTEAQICSRCRHANILKLLGCCLEDGFLCLVYQHMRNESLDKALENRDGAQPMTWEKRVAISLGLLRAVHHLHDFGVLHGNIKSSNVLLDENFTPKLGHSGVRVHRKADYARMTTKMLNACQAHLPEEYIRSGQLTIGVDIFGCGIVLAEMLTGMRAMEEGSTVYLKDLILGEIQKAKETLGSKKELVNGSACDELAAKQICAKYVKKRTGQLPEEAAVLLATAICMCLRKKKKAAMSEICAMMEKVELQSQCSRRLEIDPMPGLQMMMPSINYPEETDDDSFLSECSASCGPVPKTLGAAALPYQQHERLLTHPSRIPCESDESEPFCDFPTVRSGAHFLPVNESVSPDSRFSESQVEIGASGVNGTHLREDDVYCCQVTSTSSTVEESQSASSTSNLEGNASKSEAPKMNEAKRKLLEKFARYEDGQIDSSELYSL